MDETKSRKSRDISERYESRMSEKYAQPYLGNPYNSRNNSWCSKDPATQKESLKEKIIKRCNGGLENYSKPRKNNTSRQHSVSNINCRNKSQNSYCSSRNSSKTNTSFANNQFTSLRQKDYSVQNIDQNSISGKKSKHFIANKVNQTTKIWDNSQDTIKTSKFFFGDNGLSDNSFSCVNKSKDGQMCSIALTIKDKKQLDKTKLDQSNHPYRMNSSTNGTSKINPNDEYKYCKRKEMLVNKIKYYTNLKHGNNKDIKNSPSSNKQMSFDTTTIGNCNENAEISKENDNSYYKKTCFAQKIKLLPMAQKRPNTPTYKFEKEKSIKNYNNKVDITNHQNVFKQVSLYSSNTTKHKDNNYTENSTKNDIGNKAHDHNKSEISGQTQVKYFNDSKKMREKIHHMKNSFNYKDFIAKFLKKKLTVDV